MTRTSVHSYEGDVDSIFKPNIGIPHCDDADLKNTDVDDLKEKSSSDPISFPFFVSSSRSVKMPLPVPPTSHKTKSKVLPPSFFDDEFHDLGGGSSQLANVQGAEKYQDVELELGTREDKDGQTKEICHPVSDIVPWKIVFGDMDALFKLVGQKGDFMERTDIYMHETGIVLDKMRQVLDSYDGMDFLKQIKLGSGSFSELMPFCYNGTQFVFKQVAGHEFQENEVLMTSVLEHHNIIKTHGLIFGRNIAAILMEDGGYSLSKYALTREFQEHEIEKLTLQGLDGLEFLDKFGIRHNNIQPDSILLSEQKGKLHLKLADFHNASWSTEDPSIGCKDRKGWTIGYLSPERVRWMLIEKDLVMFPNGNENQQINGKSDVYSFALTICYLYPRSHILQKLLNDGTNGVDLTVHVLHKLQMTNPNLAIENIPEMVGVEMRQLLAKMMCSIVAERFSAKEAKKYHNSKSQLWKNLELSEETQTVDEIGFQQCSDVTHVCPQAVEVVYSLHGGSNEITLAGQPNELAMQQQLEVPIIAQNTEKLAWAGKTGDQVDDVAMIGQTTETPLEHQEEQIDSVNMESPKTNSISPIFLNFSSKLIAQKTPFDIPRLKSRNSTSQKKVLMPSCSVGSTTSGPASILGLDRPILSPDQAWTSRCNDLTVNNVDKLPESLKRRMVKRKLQGKVLSDKYKKPKLEIETKPSRSRRGSRKTSREAVDVTHQVGKTLDLESNQDIKTISEEGSLPDFSILLL